MRLIYGVDGCKGGWIVISKDLDSGLLSWRLCHSAHELVYHEPKPHIIAIDIPIGLPEHGSRTCDLEARKILGPGRASSIFPAPIRPVLDAANYNEACRIRFQIEQKKLSLQAWAITPKIIDIDEALRQDPELQKRLREVHPEISFFFLAGQRPLQYNKKDKMGQEERFALLEPIFGHWLLAVLAKRQQLASAKDDVLDAFVALWTAERIVNGTFQTIPSEPPKDAFGLRMEMVA
jgi:predicted RNase H-like nuclease